MDRFQFLLMATALSTCACGSEGGESSPSTTPDMFPATKAGYLRLTAKTISNIPPGGDVTKCQYLMAPLDHDVDVEQVVGYQSNFGHHLIAMTYKPAPGEAIGTEFSCMGSDLSTSESSFAKNGQFLGAAGKDGQKSNVSAPDGVSLRLKAGTGVMLNLHFINTGKVPIDGTGVLDLKLVTPDPSKPVASLFTNANLNLTIPPGIEYTASIDCLVQSDIQFVMVANHMHEIAVGATTQVIHEDGTITDLHTDTTWPLDAVSNPIFTHFPVANPMVVHAGETIRTSCTWQNHTTQAITFPTEMCAGVGMALSNRPDRSVPSCVNAVWLENGF